jgi:4-hydroxyphenylacetate decarboxylase small subunit
MIEEKVLQHADCRNFCTLDVAKGLCRRSDTLVPVDSTACTCFVQLPKCKFCQNFADKGEGVGACLAEQGEPWAYPEMIAVTCEWFKAA